jgi:hypothetical protein
MVAKYSEWNRGQDEALLNKLGGIENAMKLLDSREVVVQFDAVANRATVHAESSTRLRFPVTVDYARSLEQMILAGKYGYANPDITAKNFPITGKGIVEEEIILVHFDRDISSDDAEKELATMGLEPARLEHATAFGAKYPDVQREYPIVFLGSVWTDPDGDRRVPYLDYWDGRRELRLGYRDAQWDRIYLFAAVRKVLVPAL